MKKKDWIFIIGLCVLFLVCYFIFMMFQSEKETIEVYYKDQIIDKIDISIDKTYTYEGEYGKFSLEVKERRYHATNVVCPNHDCEKMGWIKEGSPLPILCVPNQIYVIQIENK